MLERYEKSHKGQNGKIMIVGGSPMFYGAPILCSLAAEHTGCDLVFPFMPAQHHDAAKSYSLNFILAAFEDKVLSSKDVKTIVNFGRQVDCMVIGPGLGTDKKTAAAVKSILANTKVPTVVDASALMRTTHLPEVTVLTPHRGEFKELTGDEPTPKNVQKWAKHFKATVVCKGPEDIISNGDEIAINDTGNALMTVGGTGDVLSGFIGGLIARGVDPMTACKDATRILGLLAENFADLENSLRAVDLAYAIPPSLDKL